MGGHWDGAYTIVLVRVVSWLGMGATVLWKGAAMAQNVIESQICLSRTERGAFVYVAAGNVYVVCVSA